VEVEGVVEEGGGGGGGGGGGVGGGGGGGVLLSGAATADRLRGGGDGATNDVFCKVIEVFIGSYLEEAHSSNTLYSPVFHTLMKLHFLLVSHNSLALFIITKDLGSPHFETISTF
jgi:hypothetical protein